MKKATVIVFTLLFALASYTQPVEIANRIALPSDGTIPYKAKWRPDGQSLLISGIKNGGLLLFNFNDSTMERLSTARFKDATWINNTEIGYSRGDDIFTFKLDEQSDFKANGSGLFVHANLTDRKLYAYYPDRIIGV